MVLSWIGTYLNNTTIPSPANYWIKNFTTHVYTTELLNRDIFDTQWNTVPKTEE